MRKTMQGASRLARVAHACVVLGLASPRAGHAQQIPEPPATRDAQADEPAPGAPGGVSPRGALIRAMLVPGWGHVAIGSHTRGGFYFALEAATAYTFLRTRSRLFEARERAALRERAVRERLAGEGVTDPGEIESGVDADPALQGLRDLVGSREGQQEDLVAWGIFLVVLTGADAYVSAHLSRFPTPIELETSARGAGRAEVALRIPFPG